MIEVEVAPVKSFAAILAGVFVALKNVVAREFHLLLGEPVIAHQQNHPRHTQPEGYGGNRVIGGLHLRKISPFAEAESMKATGVVVVNHLSVTSEEQA